MMRVKILDPPKHQLRARRNLNKLKLRHLLKAPMLREEDVVVLSEVDEDVAVEVEEAVEVVVVDIPVKMVYEITDRC